MHTRNMYNVNSVRVFHACMVTSLCFLSNGYIDSYTSPIEDSLLKRGIFTAGSYSLFASATYLGGTLSSTVAGLIGEWFGIKTCMIVSSQLGTIGGLLLVVGHDSISMIAGRLLIGCYNGMCLSWIFVYNAEIAPDSVRILYGAVLAISIRMGVLFSYTLGIWIGYRWLAVVYLIMVVFMTLNFVYLPESPRWLRNKGLTEEANKANEYFYSSQENTVESGELSESVSDEFLLPSNASLYDRIRSYFAWPVLRPMLVCSSIQLFKSSSGHEYLLAYSAHTLQTVVSINPRIAALFFALFLLFGSIIFMWIIHRVHWKKLLLLTTVFQISSNGLLSLTIYLSDSRFHCAHNLQLIILCQILRYAPLFLVALYAFTYTLGWGSIAWWLYGQILHPHYTRVSAGIVTFVVLSVSYLNMQISPIIEEHSGSYVVFLSNTIVCVIGFILQWFY